MRIFHVATLADWQQAKQSGRYATSTYGVSLDDVGFIHAARAEQVAGVVSAHYSGVEEPIVLLEIDRPARDSVATAQKSRGTKVCSWIGGRT
jgi:uncharacterized protein (DUF952 family)